MPTKDIGTTDDATTIHISCKSINSNQNVYSSNKFKQQSTKHTDKIKHFKNTELSFGGRGEESVEEMGEDNVAEDGWFVGGTLLESMLEESLEVLLEASLR